MGENKELTTSQDDGVSIGQICSWIWSKKIIGLIVFVVVAIIGFLCIYLYSNSSSVYQISFDYGTTPNLESGTYLDGTPFNYLDVVFHTNIESVIESNDDYSNLDVEDILESITIQITYEYDENSNIIDTYYTIEVNQNCFSSKEQARQFLMDLVNVPIDTTSDYINNVSFDSFFSLIETAVTYEEEVSYITSQIELLTSGYAELINLVGDIKVYMNEGVDSLVIGDENDSVYTLSQLQNILISNLSRYNYDLLEEIIDAYNYVKLDSNGTANYYVDLYTQRLAALEAREGTLTIYIAALTEQIESIIEGNAIVDSSGLSTLINSRYSYQNELISVQQQIANISATLSRIEEQNNLGENGYIDDKAFGENLAELTAYLEYATETFTSIYKELYSRLITINYYSASIIVEDGGISTIINAGISVVLGLLVGCVVAGVLGYNSSKKKEVEFTKKA